ncbi:protein Osi24 [Choristoneura fumiferana]|uniref:protein Osi24 n=1 Tax=Choristoneura fumiferana TaxID=7141 RepID=UPI003D153612
MDLLHGTENRRPSRSEWRFSEKSLVVITYIFLLILQNNCQTVFSNETSQIENITKRLDSLDNNVESKQCHSCHNSSKFDKKHNEVPNYEAESFIDEVISTVDTFTTKYLLVNKTEKQLENEVERVLDEALSKDRYEIIDGVEIKPVNDRNARTLRHNDDAESRALFSTYTYEYRLLQKIKNFVETHIISINLPKAARFITFRSFGLKKFFVPLLFGAQLVKGMLLAMFLPSILGSFGKILGKGISQLSASSSQASNPPAVDDQTQYSNDQKDFMAYETDPAGAYAYPQDGMYVNMADPSDVNDLSNVDMSRFGAGGQKVTYLPTKTGYYKNQLASGNTYKVFQKIPASSMILSNYDPFYSPLLSRLDGIFARLGLAPTENGEAGTQIGGQSLSDVKLESCREQLICLMYASPAKYAPYSNLVSAQLSRELNELRRPVSDNPEILRFFRYMRAARRGQEGADCARAHPGCAAAAPAHTMIAAYHDINKLVTARKLRN